MGITATNASGPDLGTETADRYLRREGPVTGSVKLSPRHPSTTTPARAAPLRPRDWVHAALAFAATAASVAAVHQFALPVFHVPSSSMEPTLRPGDRIVVETMSVNLSGAGALNRGDIVVFSGAGGFDAPGEAGVYVKRIVALPGETVACCDDAGRVTVNGIGLDESYLTDLTSPFGPFEVPDQQLFVLGDHRSVSDDSRGRGTVPVGDVIGRVVAVGWPASRIGAVPSP